MQTMTLLNQTKIPVLGFGTYKITDPTLAKESDTGGNLSVDTRARGYSGFYEKKLQVGRLSGTR